MYIRNNNNLIYKEYDYRFPFLYDCVINNTS